METWEIETLGWIMWAAGMVSIVHGFIGAYLALKSRGFKSIGLLVLGVGALLTGNMLLLFSLLFLIGFK